MACGTVLQLELVVAVVVVVVEVVCAVIGTTKLDGVVAVADNFAVVEAVDNVVPMIVVVDDVVAAVDVVAVADAADVASVPDHSDGQYIEMARVHFPMVVDVRKTVVSLHYLLEADTATFAHHYSPKQNFRSCHPLRQLE